MKKLKPTLPPNTPRPAFYWDKKLDESAKEVGKYFKKLEKDNELISNK